MLIWVKHEKTFDYIGTLTYILNWLNTFDIRTFKLVLEKNTGMHNVAEIEEMTPFWCYMHG